jgi:hypothetical protein
MKSIILLICALCACASAAGQALVLRDTVLSVEPADPVIPVRAERNLERLFERPKDIRNRVTVGLLSLSNALGADGLTRGGLYWKAGDDGAFRFRSSKLSWRYNPHAFPHDPLTFLDKAIGTPIRLVTAKTLSF